ncbi:MAG TPA: hypothetical protein VFX37_08070 [Pseudolabrys sp.]|nr:hypothetical protein [Pseudolabrys sp.]
MLELAVSLEEIVAQTVYRSLYGPDRKLISRAAGALRLAAQADAVPTRPMREAVEALREINTIALAGWSDHYDQDFGTKDDDYRFDCIREQVDRALSALTRPTPDVQADAIELIQVPRVALEWLFGAMPDHEGLWFGESVKEATKKYGWRSRFREICAALGFPLHSTQRNEPDASQAAPAGQQKEG